MSHKILITNIVSLNTGDAAILQGTLELLRKKYGNDIEIIVYDKNSEVADHFYPWANFRQSVFISVAPSKIAFAIEKAGYGHWLLRLKYLRLLIAIRLSKLNLGFLSLLFTSNLEREELQHYISADLIISSGGTYLTENYYLEPAIYDYKLSIATGNYFGFFTQSLGPFKKNRNVDAFKNIFTSANFILLRDNRSYNHVLDLGVPKQNLHVTVDPAFAMIVDKPIANIRKQHRQHIRIAISVRSMKFFENNFKEKSISYYDCITLLTQIAVEEYDAEIVFLSTCQGISEYWTDDSNIAIKLVEQMPLSLRRHISINKSFHQPPEIIELYKEFDAIIATRMHAAILALCAGTPVLGLAYEFKMEKLMTNAKLPELVLPLGKNTEFDTIQVIKHLLDNLEEIKIKTKAIRQSFYNKVYETCQYMPEL